MKRTLKIIGVTALLIISLFDPTNWFSFIFWLFRKIGLFFRFAIYFLIGKKKTLKHLDRRQHAPNWFSQRGINTFLGTIIVAMPVLYSIYK